MHGKPFVCALVLALAASSASAEKGSPAFARKPAAVRDGKVVRVSFAVDRATDVAVFVEDGAGQVVRHLCAGVLGRNPPAPLKVDSLEQTVAWDGLDDDGKPAAGGPFRIRVGVGLTAKYGGAAFSEQGGPNHITNVEGLAAGPDGRVYVIDNRSGWLYWPAYAVHVFRRDGSYERTIKPFPSDLPVERVKAAGAFRNDRGYLNPIIHRALGMTFYPYEDEPASQMAVTGGRLILTAVPSQSPPTTNPMYRGIAAHLAAIDLEGGVPNDEYAGPALGKGLVYRGERREGGARLAAASDGKHVYLVNIGHRYYQRGYKLQKHHVVYRAPLPAMGPAEVFFGDKTDSGADKTHLTEPMGLAADGKGLLYVADFSNNRVVVLNEADATFVGAFDVEAPQWVAVHPRTGAVYVHSKDRLIRFSGWHDAKEEASLNLGSARKGLIGWRKTAQRLTFALDASADPAVIWMGLALGAHPLQRCEDRGKAFSDLVPARCFKSPRQWRPASDPAHRMVLCRVDADGGDRLHVLDETTGRTRTMRVPRGFGNNQGITSRLDREGNIYSTAAAGGIWKSDPTGKMIPFPATAKDPKLKGHLPGGSSGTTAWERDFSIDRHGDIYAKVRGTQYHGLMHVDVFAPDGRLKRTVLWGVTDGAYGPRVDPAGNLYLMECVKPAGWRFPEAFAPYVTDRWEKHWYDWIYGSIVKFGPAGGNLWLKSRRPEKDHPKADPVPLPDTLPKKQVASSLRGDENRIQGALWIHPGVSHVGDMGIMGGGEHCHCTGCDFDVDDFGRAFAPDNGRQRVTVLDTNGNVILHVGGCGNQDHCGPDSYVRDPDDGRLRPRRADDPKDLASPFAEPEIAFSWIIGVAATDRHVYVADTLNRRVLRCRLGYAAEVTTEVK